MSNYNENSNFGLLEKFPPIISDEPKKEITEKPVKKVDEQTKDIKKPKKKKKKIYKKKCNVCKKKLSLVERQLTCKCGMNFCAKHRLQCQHNCIKLKDFDPELHRQKCGLGGGKFKQLEVL